MKVPFYDIKAQYDELSEPLDAAVHAVLASGVYTISGGRECAEFEREFAEYLGVAHAVSVNSGTDALRILLDATGIGPGDEVVTSAFTFVASVETIVQTGARPVFADIDPRSFMVRPEAVAAAITPRTRAIMPVHLFGQLADMAPLAALAERNGLLLLEDAAQAVGSSQNGVAPGAFGSGGAFSFYVTKNLGAAGDAGLLATNDAAVAERARSIRVHGMGRERYYYDHLGYTSRMDEIQAAILRVKLRRLDAWNARRAEIAGRYLAALAGAEAIAPRTEPGNRHAWHQFSVRSPRRDALQAALREREVDSMIYYPVPIHFHEPYRAFGGGEGSLPETEAAAREILNLPIHPHLRDEQVEFVAAALAELARDAAACG